MIGAANVVLDAELREHCRSQSVTVLTEGILSQVIPSGTACVGHGDLISCPISSSYDEVT